MQPLGRFPRQVRMPFEISRRGPVAIQPVCTRTAAGERRAFEKVGRWPGATGRVEHDAIEIGQMIRAACRPGRPVGKIGGTST